MSYDGLYYPWIDPPHRATLATAMLYWDHIFTITPHGYGDCYRSEHSRAANRLGFLRPRAVRSGSEVVRTASDEFLKDYRRPAIRREATKIRQLSSGGVIGRARMHTEKMSGDLRRALVRNRKRDAHGFYRIEQSLASAYMARLAAVVARRDNMPPYTDWRTGHACVVDRYAELSSRSSREAAEATLAVLSFSAFRIPAHVSLGEVWRFRERHYDELTRYRRALRRLARLVPRSVDVQKMHRECTEVFNDEVYPATEEIAAKLAENGINFALAACESATLGIAAWSLVGPKAIAVAATHFGLRISFAHCRQRIARARAMRSPFSYLMRARARFDGERSS